MCGVYKGIFWFNRKKEVNIIFRLWSAARKEMSESSDFLPVVHQTFMPCSLLRNAYARQQYVASAKHGWDEGYEFCCYRKVGHADGSRTWCYE